MVGRGTLAEPSEGAATLGLPNPGRALVAELTLQAAEEHRVRVPHVEVVQQHEGAGAAGADAAERSQQQPTEGPGTGGEAGNHLHLLAGEAGTWTPEAPLGGRPMAARGGGVPPGSSPGTLWPPRPVPRRGRIEKQGTLPEVLRRRRSLCTLLEGCA